MVQTPYRFHFRFRWIFSVSVPFPTCTISVSSFLGFFGNEARSIGNFRNRFQAYALARVSDLASDSDRHSGGFVRVEAAEGLG